MANEEEKEKLSLEKLYSEVLRENLGIQRVNTDELKTQIDLSKQIGGAFKITNEQGKAILKNSRDLSKQTANILRDEDAIIKGRRSIKDINKEITKSTQTQNSALKEITQVTSQIASLQNRMKDDPKEVTEENMKQEAVLKNILRGLESNAIISGENLEALEKELAIRDRIEKKLGVLGVLVGSIGKIPIIGEFLNANEVLAEMEEKAAKVGSNRFSVMGAGIKEIGKQLNDKMLDPLVMISALIGAGLTVDQRVTELERSLGVSNEEAVGLENRFQAIASNSGKLAINTKEVTVAFNALNAQIGGAATTFSDELLESAAELIKLNNLSEESAARFALSAQRSGQELENVKNESIAVINASTQERGLRLDINKVLDEAGKITGVIAANLGGNIVAISKAISVAKQFGMELQEVAAAGRTLLEFETSIENELKAELLTGKQINLERARLAALTGDYETLTREINKNVGDFGDFTAMNVLQQEALAASVGMTADQLSDVLLKNKDIEKLAQEARDAGNEDLAQQLEKRSVQEQFNDTVLKLKGIFVDIMSGPLMGILETIGGLLAGFGKFLGMLGLGKGGFADLVVQIGFFAVLLQKSFGTFTKIIGAMKAMKGLTLAQKMDRIAINAAEKIGLVTKRQARMAQLSNNILQRKEYLTTKLTVLQKQAKVVAERNSLGLLIKQNVQNAVALVRAKIAKGLELGKNAIMAVGNSIRGLGIVQQGISNKRGVFGLFRQGAQAILGGIKAGTQAPFPANIVLPFILGGLIGAIVAGLIAKFSKGDDIFSGPRGGSGYGSRMLLAPEGAFALNNKDTVIAGTNLFKANDVAMGGEGSINVSKIASNNQQSTSNNDAIMGELVNEIKGLRGDTQSVAKNVTMADQNAQRKPVVNTSSIFNHQRDANNQVNATLLT